MTNGTDIQKWNYTQEKTKDLKLRIQVEGDGFVLENQKGLSLGSFPTVNNLFNFLCGFEHGNNTLSRIEKDYEELTISVLEKLAEEAQERFHVGSEIIREEILAWLNSRKVHWFHADK